MIKSRVHLIAAARPNFMKVAPLWHALSASEEFEPVLVHTGQHYDANMSEDILRDLKLPPIVKRTLSNGLPVWIVEQHEVPVASVSLTKSRCRSTRTFPASANPPAPMRSQRTATCSRRAVMWVRRKWRTRAKRSRRRCRVLLRN